MWFGVPYRGEPSKKHSCDMGILQNPVFSRNDLVGHSDSLRPLVSDRKYDFHRIYQNDRAADIPGVPDNSQGN